MSDNKKMGARLRQAREASGYSSASDAAEALGMVYSTYAGHENGNRAIVGSLERYARRFGVSVDWLLTGRGEGPKPGRLRLADFPAGKVPLMGKVGAGQAIIPMEADAIDWVDEPATSNSETQAVQVSGDSMFPAYEDGTLIYYSRTLPPEQMVNRRAVVKLADESMWVKVLRPGSAPGLWTLQSVNSQYQDMVDKAVEWAAPIEWTKSRS